LGEVDNASFVAPDARYVVPLCLPTERASVFAFLDDDEDADADDVMSGDDEDSCPPGTMSCASCTDYKVHAGETVDLRLELFWTCGQK
jgi:hypothetical protein